MHPAKSVIFFTISGAGFGLMRYYLWRCVWGSRLLIPLFISAQLSRFFGSAGLISSTFHLGNPQRAAGLASIKVLVVMRVLIS